MVTGQALPLIISGGYVFVKQSLLFFAEFLSLFFFWFYVFCFCYLYFHFILKVFVFFKCPLFWYGCLLLFLIFVYLFTGFLFLAVVKPKLTWRLGLSLLFAHLADPKLAILLFWGVTLICLLGDTQLLASAVDILSLFLSLFPFCYKVFIVLVWVKIALLLSGVLSFILYFESPWYTRYEGWSLLFFLSFSLSVF